MNLLYKTNEFEKIYVEHLAFKLNIFFFLGVLRYYIDKEVFFEFKYREDVFGLRLLILGDVG